ncbi:unnamed protein product [Victoria cruziana]
MRIPFPPEGHVQLLPDSIMRSTDDDGKPTHLDWTAIKRRTDTNPRKPTSLMGSQKHSRAAIPPRSESQAVSSTEKKKFFLPR